MKAIKCYWWQVFGLGVTFDYIWVCHETDMLLYRNAIYVKIFLGPWLVLVNVPVSRWRSDEVIT